MSDELDNMKRKEKNWSRHPMVVLLCGALISSFLIPAYQRNGRVQAEKQKLRTEFVQEIHRFDGEINMNLNALTTTMEMAVKLLGPASTDAEFLQAKKDALRDYAKFDQIAWWKLDAICAAFIASNEVSSERSIEIWAAVADYEAVLTKRTKQFDPAWLTFERSQQAEKKITKDWFEKELRPAQLDLARQGQMPLTRLIELSR